MAMCHIGSCLMHAYGVGLCCKLCAFCRKLIKREKEAAVIQITL